MKVQVRDRNLDASIVSGIGGLVILYVGLIGLRLVLFGGDTATLDISEVVLGTLWGVLIIIFSLLMFLDLKRNRVYGAAIIVLSFASWYGTSGGLFLGFVFAFLGGVMGYIWKPKPGKIEKKAVVEQVQQQT